MTQKTDTNKSLLDEIILGIENVKGEEILILDLREIDNTPCEYFVVCSANSNTQVSAIVSSVKKMLVKLFMKNPSILKVLK